MDGRINRRTRAPMDGGTNGNTGGWTDQQNACLGVPRRGGAGWGGWGGGVDSSNGVLLRWMRGRMLWLGASAAK